MIRSLSFASSDVIFVTSPRRNIINRASVPVFQLQEREVVHENDLEALADRVEDELDAVARQVYHEVHRERLLVAAWEKGQVFFRLQNKIVDNTKPNWHWESSSVV